MSQIALPDWDRELFVYLNSKNAGWLDPVMILLSTYTAWTVLCVLVMFLMVYKDRVQGKIAALFLVVGIGLNLLLNTFVKLLIMRPRPGNEDLLTGVINQLEAVGESYSFFSAHSLSSVCLATFTTLYFKNKLYGIAIFAWALAVAYSRIYVGKHYPLDVLVGILFGLLTGWLSYWVYRRYNRPSMLPEEKRQTEAGSF
ncbi:MAG: phosphatase PAP2 family protein [Tannerellaceae bacterium]|nr:phosphatase PAP2 family protein [Tannerellaceae bacterium]